VLAPIVGNLVAAGLNVLGRPCRFSTPQLGALSDVLTDGRRLLASRLSWWVQTNADQVIIGRRLGGPALGIYSLAASIASLPVDKITALVSQVSPPFVAAARSDPRETRRLLFVLSGTLAVVALPVAAGIALVADEFVPLVLGAQWSEAILPLQLLAALAAPKCVISVLATVVLMTGGIRLSMVLSIVEAFVMTAVFYVASGYGVAGVAAGALLAYPLLRGPLIWLAFRRLDVDPADYLSALWPGLRATALMILAVLACESLLRPGTSELASLAAQVSVGVAAYALASFAGHRRLRGMLRDFRALGTR
jgi:PST family polysaccharide transporter